MTTRIERWLLDTNVWLFGLRRDEQFHACTELLYLVGKFSVVIPLQVLKELNANFTDDEARSFHRLVNDQPHGRSEFLPVMPPPFGTVSISFFVNTCVTTMVIDKFTERTHENLSANMWVISHRFKFTAQYSTANPFPKFSPSLFANNPPNTRVGTTVALINRGG